MMLTVMLRCTCCGQFTAEQISIQMRGWRKAHPTLRVLMGNKLLGYFRDPDEAAAVLARYRVGKLVEVPGSQSQFPPTVDCPK